MPCRVAKIVVELVAADAEAEARALYAAIADKQDGVLRWIKNYW